MKKFLMMFSMFVVFAAVASAQVTGTGTTGTVTKWVTPTEVGDSVIKEENGNVAIGQSVGTNSRFRVFYLPPDRNGANAIHGTLGPSQEPNGQTTGSAVAGFATNSIGSTQGVKGVSYSNIGIGVQGVAVNETGSNKGVQGSSLSDEGIGVYGVAGSTTGVNYGVFGKSNSPNGFAGYFEGNATVTGNLSKGGGSFKIDHPLDPENKYLSHSFVESPDMMNIYNGIVKLDGSGMAEVTMPDYFDALNRDFRYQLTCIGGFAPVYVAGKVSGNRFKIAGGTPGMEVSWQLTGVRKDAYAEKHRIKVEEMKPVADRGSYLHPDAFGKPKNITSHRPEISPEKAKEK